tara:strand:- start:269 stop:394 length:126 start_codon:yes stop_codon:yes gene_type:complete
MRQGAVHAAAVLEFAAGGHGVTEAQAFGTYLLTFFVGLDRG